MSNLLDRLLAGTLADPDGPGHLTVPVRSVVIGTQLAKAAAELIQPLELGSHIAIVSDPATRHAMGEAVVNQISTSAQVTEIVLDEKPHSDMETVERVRAIVGAAAEVTGVIAVGSGTVNDVGKFAAHLEKRPFAVFGTAPSMNGYTSVSAAITERGLKKSLASTAPRGVFLDLDVLAAAPRRLIAAGFGDSICRSTAQVDWLAAHLILGRPYREAPFMLLKDDEEALVTHAVGLIQGDRRAIEILARTLVMSGLGMTICGGSHPASQAEHLISHFVEMLGDASWPTSYHGEHISVTTITSARLQERLYLNGTPKLRATPENRDDLVIEFGEQLGESCWSSFNSKRLSEDDAALANQRLLRYWREIQGSLLKVMRPARDIEAALKSVGAPLSPAGIGIPLPFYRRAVAKSRLIRDRFTCLDMAAAQGVLDSFAAGLA